MPSGQSPAATRAHTIMGIGQMGALCEMAWNQGDDLYGHDDNRFMKAAEYVARYNLGQDVPSTRYTWGTGTTCARREHTVISDAGRGQARPVWDIRTTTTPGAAAWPSRTSRPWPSATAPRAGAATTAPTAADTTSSASAPSCTPSNFAAGRTPARAGPAPYEGDPVNRRTTEAARAGDRAALDDLLTGHLPLLYNIVGRALDGHPDVDVVVQETMLDAVRGIGGLRDPAAFRSWLVAIAMSGYGTGPAHGTPCPPPGLRSRTRTSSTNPPARAATSPT